MPNARCATVRYGALSSDWRVEGPMQAGKRSAGEETTSRDHPESIVSGKQRRHRFDDILDVRGRSTVRHVRMPLLS